MRRPDKLIPFSVLFMVLLIHSLIFADQLKGEDQQQDPPGNDSCKYNGQEKIGTQVLEYNFLTKVVSQNDNSQYGKYTILKITDINRFLFDVKIISTQIEIESELNNDFISAISKSEVNNPDSAVENTATQLDKEINTQLLEKSIPGFTTKEAAKLSTDNLLTQAKKVNNKFRDLERIKDIKNRLINLTLTEHLTHAKSNNYLERIRKDYPEYDSLHQLIADYRVEYEKFKNELSSYPVLPEDTNVAKVNKLVEKLNKSVEATNSMASQTDYQEIINDIERLDRGLSTEVNFYAVSEPVYAEKDAIEFDVKISPKKELIPKLGITESSFKLKTPIKGGFRFDFSSGIVGLFDLYDRSFGLRQLDSTRSLLTELSNKNEIDVSLGMMMHISYRFASDIRPAFTIGLGLDVEDISESNVYAGLSLIFGKEDQLIFTGGLAFKRILDLNPKYELNKGNLTSSFGEDFTITAYRMGLFAGFTYNFTGGD